ncbi:hypothetical protein DSCA_11150 [Desulfosarcina alkanivorans]|uniref:DUF2169 domain-containing protein n=1 Tax=Desulfosarcina alkanivorans TaxID=571177 RepID=A0A5K7YFE2_9BACT|nr:DUF2169 domain-containing protein [Desulfosarcina alkanivorans]BBO67185.1 hypothetical protein DSCA_11150 [Desulfosarcina alkanivorans]
MDIINDTPFTFGYMAGRMPFPGHSLTLIVKGTFDLVPDGVVVLSAEQQLPTGDEYYEDDEEMQGGPRYATDFACYKPLADLSLAGHCHAPQGTLTPARRVSFQVGDVVRSLTVYGDRYWMGPIATDPEPFQKMALRYDYSYGGKGFKENPTGRGYAKTEDRGAVTRRYLPNIMQPGEQMATPLSRLEPAGFGPIHREWAQRKSKLGSYKGSYLKTRWPWFAEDMDWRYFNAAPQGLQTQFLRGDEALYFENLHGERQDYRSRLAGLQTRCFVNCTAADRSGKEPFSEVVMNLDTLWVDMDNEKVVLVWRGWTRVLSEEFEEVEQILIASEQIGHTPEPVSYYENLLYQRMREEEALWEEAAPPEEPAPEIGDDTETLIAEAEASYCKAMKEAGMDPDHPQGPSAADKLEEERVLRELGLDRLDPPAPELTRESVAARFNDTGNIAGLNLEDLDLSGLDFSGGMLQEAVMTRANLSGAVFDGADLTGAVMADVDLSGASFKKANLTDADFSMANCTGIDMTGATITDAVFDSARLTRARIEKADATGASFIEADLSGASLVHTDLAGADLSAANLAQSNLSGANLVEATLEAAQGPDVVMDGADLTELRASEKCAFNGGSFRQVKAEESIWESADLRDADFSFARMAGASFSKARLRSARLSAADLKNARFEKADLSNADLVYANLLESSFEGADLTRCDCRNANLYGAEFLNATVDQTRFEKANLKMTQLNRSRAG